MCKQHILNTRTEHSTPYGVLQEQNTGEDSSLYTAGHTSVAAQETATLWAAGIY